MANETFRTHKKERFTIVDNALINNNSISWAAKGLLIYLLSKPDGWKVYKADIVKHATNGIDSVKALIKELRKTGYITLTRVTDEKGKIVEWRYDVYDEPLDTPVEGHLRATLTSNGLEVPAEEDKAEHPDEIVSEDLSSVIPVVEDSENPLKKPQVEFPLVDNLQQNESGVETQKWVFHKWETQQQVFPPTSNTEDTNTKRSNTQSIISDRTKEALFLKEKEYGGIVFQLKENLEFDVLGSRAENKGWMEEWIFLVAEYLTAADSSVNVNGANLPKELVKDRILKLEEIHFSLVKDNLANLATPIMNMRKYIFTALYNATFTCHAEIENEINTITAL